MTNEAWTAPAPLRFTLIAQGHHRKERQDKETHHPKPPLEPSETSGLISNQVETDPLLLSSLNRTICFDGADIEGVQILKAKPILNVNKQTKLFTIGPVEMDKKILDIGAKQPLYFRDDAFSEILKEVSRGILEVCGAPAASTAAVLTSSGTAAMEAAVINLFSEKSKVLVIDSGSFGRLFLRICQAHQIPHEVVRLAPGTTLHPNHLEPHEGRPFDGLLVNAHETSTGQLHDLRMVGKFCKANGIILVCDAISTILADPFNMADMNIDVAVLSSNKGLALPPGLAFVVLTDRVCGRLCSPRSVYLDLASYIADLQRGHTPFTSAISIIMMLQERLNIIRREGGPAAVIARVAALSADFRDKAECIGALFFPEVPSNAMTAIRVANGSSARLYREIRDDFGFYINPSAYGFEEEIIRVSHLGELTFDDNSRLVSALNEKKRIWC